MVLRVFSLIVREISYSQLLTHLMEKRIGQETPLTVKQKPKDFIPIADDGFQFPFGGEAACRPIDNGWYVALGLGEGRYSSSDIKKHLGEDWNLKGKNDCGESIFAIANGKVILAGYEGGCWGNVVIIRHQLPTGEQHESFYGHLGALSVSAGDEVKRGDVLATSLCSNCICGDPVPCHLHFEIREEGCPDWGNAGPGYEVDNRGRVLPSQFIDYYKTQACFGVFLQD
ncbi:MAG: M23 family metallopeptidase [Haliscomenobacter sp.]|nr:M23 family metallopeptidase [Haliscomenobacter sp.]